MASESSDWGWEAEPRQRHAQWLPLVSETPSGGGIDIQSTIAEAGLAAYLLNFLR